MLLWQRIIESSHGQGHLPLDQVALSPIQPGLKHCQGGGSHNGTGGGEVVWGERNWPWLVVEKRELTWPSSTSVIVYGERRAGGFSDLSLPYSPVLQQYGN